jgi:hypothetical protein
MLKIPLQKLRDEGLVPRVHGNGFMQLDLDANKRLNIWGHPDLPRQKVDTSIHDHRFGFISKVIVGELIQTSYDVSVFSTPTHQVFTPVVREGEDTVLAATPELLQPYILDQRIVHAGQEYQMPPRAFHTSKARIPTATLLIKTLMRSADPVRVLVPIGRLPDNDFNRNAFDADTLWRIAAEVLGDLVEA